MPGHSRSKNGVASLAYVPGFCFVVWAAVTICLGISPTYAQDAVADFYRGKQINIIVGSTAGGGYDAYARLIARHFSEHMPGNPEVVVQNMPGAGSGKSAGYIYRSRRRTVPRWLLCSRACCSIR